MRNKNILFLVVFLFGMACVSMAQITNSYPIRLQWNGVMEDRNVYGTSTYISLQPAEYEGAMPVFSESFPVFDHHVDVKAQLNKVVTAPLTPEELQIAKAFTLTQDFEVKANTLRSREESLLNVRIVPFRKNGNAIEKLVSASLSVTLTPDFEGQKDNPSYAERSALASGNWYKVGLPETGIYKLTYADLSNSGVDVDHVDPRQIRMYHNGGGVLPEMNNVARHDDLVEIPIYVYGESDGKFDNNDYILFYGRGPVCWKYDGSKTAYVHEQNPYDDYAYAFVVTGLGQGKRIEETNNQALATTETVSQFLDHQVHELDEFSLFRVGRTYYGDKMDLTSMKSFDFNFPNVVTTKPCRVNTALAGRNKQSASFDVMIDNVKKATYSITSYSSDYYYGYDVGGWVSANPTSETVRVTLKHNAFGAGTSEGYVDYITVNAWRDLKFVGGQMLFRNPDASINYKVYEYLYYAVDSKTVASKGYLNSRNGALVGITLVVSIKCPIT